MRKQFVNDKNAVVLTDRVVILIINNLRHTIFYKYSNIFNLKYFHLKHALQTR